VTFHYQFGRTVLLASARLLWRFRATGRERIPRGGPAVIACNHISNWDPVLVGLGCPREIHFLAKEELFRNRFLSAIIRAYNAIPVRRGALDRRALRRATDVLKSDEVLLMFPEGTRSTTGKLRKPRPGVGFIAGSSGVPVVPAYIAGSEALGRSFRTRKPVRVAFGTPLPAEKAETREGYVALTDRIMDAIRDLKREVERE